MTITPLIEWSFKVEINDSEKAASIVSSLDEKEKELLLEALNNSQPKQETTEKTYEHLLKKPNMTATDKANMENSIKFLIDKKMDTSENVKKLEAINYGIKYREIGWVKFSREKFIPKVKFNNKPNTYNVFESKEKGIFRTMDNGKQEHYLTTDAYIAQCEKQNKKAIQDTHIRKALQALSREFSDNNWYIGWNIMWNLLDLSISGYVDADGKPWRKDDYGYLCSASPVDINYTRAFEFHKDKGELYNTYLRKNARPCLFLIE